MFSKCSPVTEYPQQDRQCTYNVTFRHVHETIVAVEKQWILHSLCVCVVVGARTRACLRACSLTNSACNAPPCCHLRPLWLHQMFRHSLINGTIFGKTLQNMKCMFWVSLQRSFETFLILWRIQRDIVINVETSLDRLLSADGCERVVPYPDVELGSAQVGLVVGR
jgi:hypothetical protein